MYPDTAPGHDIDTQRFGAGALGGGAFGGLVGLVVGTTMSLTMGPILLVGASAVAGLTAVSTAIGATYGGLFGALLGWGMGADDVQAYLKGIQQGQVMLTVRVEPERAEETADVLRSHHGQTVAIRYTFQENGV